MSVSMKVCNPSSEIQEVAGFMGKLTNSVWDMLNLRLWGHLDGDVYKEKGESGGSGSQGGDLGPERVVWPPSGIYS